MIQVINDVQENVRRFNQEEAVWRCFEEKLKKLHELFPRRLNIADALLDRLAWAAAEREMQRSDWIGKTLP
ncbi:MAG: hypothetical protein ACREIF_06695 [Chthoniobacterales bacterium]